jgi:hypothetical protein
LANRDGERIIGEAEEIDFGDGIVDISDGDVDLELPYVSSLLSPLGST